MSGPVHALIERLTTLTRERVVRWEELGPGLPMKLQHEGVKYLLDLPSGSNNDIMLLVDDIEVWKGFDLMELRKAVLDALPRHKPVPEPPRSPMEDHRAQEAVARALKSLED